MTLLANYTAVELEEAIENDKISPEEMIENYMDATEITTELSIEWNVGRDWNQEVLDIHNFDSLEDLEDFLLNEELSFIEAVNDIRFDLALDVVEAYVAKDTELLEDVAFSIVEDVVMTVDEKVYFVIDFVNVPESFKKHFNIK